VELSGKTVFFVSRPSFVSRQRAARLAARARAKMAAGKPGAGSIAVHGLGGALGRLAKGTLLAEWDRLARRRIHQMSEIGFLRAVGLMPTSVPVQLIAAANFAALSGLDDATVQSLVITGALEPEDGQFPFRDVRLGREVARLLVIGYPLVGVAEAVALMRRHEGAEISAGEDEIAVRVREARIELSGQTLLPFDDVPADLNAVLDRAEAAAEEGDAAATWRLLEIAVMARPRDAVIRYNLGCVLTNLSRPDEAETHFRIAASLDPSLAEAHFNIAHVRRLKNDAAGERDALEQAVRADPEYLDALIALARWHIARDEFAPVRPLLEQIDKIGIPESQADFVHRAKLLCDLAERR